MTESEPEPAPHETPDVTPEETLEEKRARVMARLAEIIRADPPDLSGSGPVTAGAFPALPDSADDLDQEKAAELFAALGEFFERAKQRPGSEDPGTE